jgi:DNA-binding CsgD family transcriptional regulator
LFKAKLSPRQRDVLRLAAMGYSEVEIARILVLSGFTVKNYLRSARAALGARNTANAVAIALSGRMIQFETA